MTDLAEYPETVLSNVRRKLDTFDAGRLEKTRIIQDALRCSTDDVGCSRATALFLHDHPNFTDSTG